MDTTKIVEALEDLRAKRAALDQAIASLEAALNVLSASQTQTLGAGQTNTRSASPVRIRLAKSHMDWAIDVLREEGEMHIEELARRVSESVGYEVSRASLDGGISREIRIDNESSRFERSSPGVYRLRHSESSQMPLPSVAANE